MGTMKIGEVIRKWRLMSDLTLREAGKQIGLNHSTLSRIECGHMPDAETLATCIMFLISAPKGKR